MKGSGSGKKDMRWEQLQMIVVDANSHASEKKRHEHYVDCLMALKWVSCSIMATGDVP